VTFACRRNGEQVSLQLREGDWGLETRPWLRGYAEQALARALEATGAERGKQLESLASGDERPAVRTWLLVEAAEAIGGEEGERLWADAVEAAGNSRHGPWSTAHARSCGPPVVSTRPQPPFPGARHSRAGRPARPGADGEPGPGRKGGD
jgi:hypothetical protein